MYLYTFMFFKCLHKNKFFLKIINWFILTLVTNLRFITTLLSYKSVDEILTILKQHQSILVNSFNNIVDEIEASIIQYSQYKLYFIFLY